MSREKSPVFEETYRYYLKQLAGMNLESGKEVLGIRVMRQSAWVDFFKTTYRLDRGGITDKNGIRPSFDVCVVLMKYLLSAPGDPAPRNEWIAFREIPGAMPLVGYFTRDVEKLLANSFTEKSELLQKAATGLGGGPVRGEWVYDAALIFQALPRIQLLVLFNDTDDEFPSRCSVLFEDSAPDFLDPECLAITAAYLARNLARTVKEA